MTLLLDVIIALLVFFAALSLITLVWWITNKFMDIKTKARIPAYEAVPVPD